MVKHILLTGASGNVGFETLKELIRRKDRYHTRILSLDKPSEKKRFNSFRNGFEIVWGDIRDYSVVRRAVAGVDVILHTAGIIPPAADKNPELARQVNVEGTRNLVNAGSENEKPPKIVYTSSISVYGDRLENPYINVDDPLNPSDGDEYARTKIEAEQIIKGSGLNWSIFRLCGVFIKNLRLQPLMFHMPLDTALEWCHPADAGYALVQSIENDMVDKQVFNLGGGENCRAPARNFMRQVFDIWGLDMNILPDYAFANRNFHSGYYQDGHKLNRILNFQRTTLQDYLQTLRNKVSPVQRILVKAVPNAAIRYWLLRLSEPLKAIRKNNEELIERYYGSRQHFEQLIRGSRAQVLRVYRELV